MLEILVLSGVLFSILFPKRRVWPPPSRKSWQFYLSWTICSVGIVAPFALGILDFESLGYNCWLGYFAGTFAVIVGIVLNLWGINTLSIHQSIGLKGKLITQGPYKYSLILNIWVL